MKNLNMKKQNKLTIFIVTIATLMSMHSYAEYDDNLDFKDKIIGQVGKIKLKREHCNAKTYACDYVVYDAKGKKTVLIDDWSKTAVVYQFSPTIMGLMIGATGNDHNLTVINDQNQQKDYGSFLDIDNHKSCFVTYESNIKNMPPSLVFYSVPDFRVRLVINQKVPQFKQFDYPQNQSFKDNGDYSFTYSYLKEHEAWFQDVIIQKPCQKDYRIIMN